MKNLLVSIVVLSIVSGCKTWNGAMIVPNHDPITPKLLTLERRIEDISLPNVATTHVDNRYRLNDEILLFTKEVEENLIDPYGDKYGTIALKRNIIDVRYGIGNFILSSFLLTIPNLLGLPFMNIRYQISVEVRIMDRNNKLIGNYNAIGRSGVKVAYYYGYSLRNAHADRKAYTDALIDALNQIRVSIQADATKINEKLLATGRH
jgi:hypothetical protein